MNWCMLCLKDDQGVLNTLQAAVLLPGVAELDAAPSHSVRVFGTYNNGF